MLHTVHTVLHIMYSFVFKHSGQCHIIKTSRQAGSHLKLIFVKDFPCKIEIRDIYRYIYIYKIWAAYEMLGTSAIKYFFDKQQ